MSSTKTAEPTLIVCEPVPPLKTSTFPEILETIPISGFKFWATEITGFDSSNKDASE